MSNLYCRNICRCGWITGGALGFLCGLLLLLPDQSFAHGGHLSGLPALLPACRVEINVCTPELPSHAIGQIKAFPAPRERRTPAALVERRLVVREELTPLANVPCQNGFAELYPCKHVDLLAFLPVTLFGDTAGNTLWGWTDPLTAKEYAVVGVRNGTAFVDISTPTAPRYLGKLPTHTRPSLWRDMKVYQNYAFIVSDSNPGHGMQIFDLTSLRTLSATTPITLSEIAHYNVFSSSHNLVINEASGFAYAVGTETCNGGLHMIDIRQPLTPTAAGCYGDDGYVHDAQCVIYNGPDTAYVGHELCFNANGSPTPEFNQLTIVDVTDKTQPVRLSTARWEGMGYIHQGWLTEDQRYFLVDDELDEQNYHHNARTYVVDVGDIDQPTLIGIYTAPHTSVDHNLYISGAYAYQANYTAGLRVLDLRTVAQGRLREVAYFDTYPGSDAPDYDGAWSPYPFFASGVVLVSTIDRGLFILKPKIPEQPVEDGFFFLPLIKKQNE